MHLAVEMIRQSSIVVQSTQIRTTHVADLQFLMAAGARGVGQGFEVALFFFFAGLGGADFVEFGVGSVHGAGFAQDADFEEAGVDGAREVGDLFELRGSVRLSVLFCPSKTARLAEAYKGIGLSDLVGRLF